MSELRERIFSEDEFEQAKKKASKNLIKLLDFIDELPDSPAKFQMPLPYGNFESLPLWPDTHRAAPKKKKSQKLYEFLDFIDEIPDPPTRFKIPFPYGNYKSMPCGSYKPREASDERKLSDLGYSDLPDKTFKGKKTSR